MNLITTPLKTIYYSSPITPDIHYIQNWIELDHSALKHNIDQFQQWLGPQTTICAVIKSNAYGHGLIPLAKMYESHQIITRLAVINLYEAIELRLHGIQKPILVMGYLDADYSLIIKYNIDVVIYNLTTADTLQAIAQQHNTNINIHIKYDTGMSRLGVQKHQLQNFIQHIKTLSHITLQGIFSHFAQSYNPEPTLTQESLFMMIEHKNIEKHISNSHGVLHLKHKDYAYARIGIGLYGYLQKHNITYQQLLRPVLSLKTKILQIKTVKAGSYIGYDGTYQASQDMVIAILAIGYAEGLDARLSNCGKVIINNHFAPIIGRICMNLTIVDISLIPNCTQGQAVTVLGKEETLSISMYDWSIITQASCYNLLTKLSPSIIRIVNY